MQVASDSIPIDDPAQPILSIVAIACHHFCQGEHRRAMIGAPTVVFKPHEIGGAVHIGPCWRPVVRGKLNNSISNKPLFASHGVDIKHAHARQLLASVSQEVVAEKLVAATDSQHHQSILNGASQPLALAQQEVVGNKSLAAILPPPEECQVVVFPFYRCAYCDRVDLQRYPAPLATSGQRNDIAPVAVDIHMFRVEMSKPEWVISHRSTIFLVFSIQPLHKRGMLRRRDPLLERGQHPTSIAQQ